MTETKYGKYILTEPLGTPRHPEIEVPVIRIGQDVIPEAWNRAPFRITMERRVWCIFVIFDQPAVDIAGRRRCICPLEPRSSGSWRTGFDTKRTAQSVYLHHYWRFTGGDSLGDHNLSSRPCCFFGSAGYFNNGRLVS